MFETATMLVSTTRRAMELRGSAKAVVWSVARRQILFTGVDAIPLIAVLGAAVGVLVVLQSVSYLPQVGAAKFMGDLLVLLIMRELGPILVAFVVIARSGTAIAAELGTMSVQGETEGLTGCGIDPLVYIVWPRLVGAVTAVIGLTVVFTVVAFLAGFGVASLMKLSAFGYLLDTLFRSMQISDLILFITKSGLMGISIAIICAAYGMSATEGSTDVPRKTLAAVVASFRAVLVIEVIATLFIVML